MGRLREPVWEAGSPGSEPACSARWEGAKRTGGVPAWRLEGPHAPTWRPWNGKGPQCGPCWKRVVPRGV